MKYMDLHLDESAQQDPLLNVDVSTLKGPDLHMDVFTCRLQKPVLLLDLSTPQRLVLNPGRVSLTEA
jgi:hypothetical protein